MIVSISTMSDRHFNYCVHYSEGPGEQPGKTITFESIRQYLNIVRRVSNTAIEGPGEQPGRTTLNEITQDDTVATSLERE